MNTTGDATLDMELFGAEQTEEVNARQQAPYEKRDSKDLLRDGDGNAAAAAKQPMSLQRKYGGMGVDGMAAVVVPSTEMGNGEHGAGGE